MTRILRAALPAYILSVVALAQNGSIEGRVTNEAGAPLKNAFVQLRPSPGLPFAGFYTETDAEGNFVLDDLEPRRYNLTVTRTGYLGHGSSTPFTVTPGLRLTGISVKLKRAALITGRVVDEDGAPVPDARVEARLDPLSPGGSVNARADGSFVITGPGSFYISAEPSMIGTSPSFRDLSGPQLGYVVTYFPGTADPSKATLVTVKAGEEVHNLVIRMAKGRLFHVGGKMVNQDTGTPLANVTVALRSVTLQGLGQVQRTGGDGTFEFSRVAPGDYVVYDDAANPSTPQLVGRRKVTVANDNIDGLVLSVGPGLEIPGKIVLDGGGDTSVIDRGMVRLDLTTDDPVQPMVYYQFARQAGGGFSTRNLEPDVYRVTAKSLPSRTYVKSVHFGGKDITNESLDLTGDIAGKALEILLSPHAGEITGVVRDAGGAALADVEVTLRGPREYLEYRGTDEGGRFEFQNLAPGQYRIGASASGSEDKSDFDSQAARLTLTEDAKVTVTPPLIVRK